MDSMFTLLDIMVATTNLEAVQTVVKQCCEETGDLFLGERFYNENDEVSLFVRLQHNFHLTPHLTVLDQALQHGLIVSFQSALYDHMINASCPPPLNIQAQLQDFPLRPGETWFSRLSDVYNACICTRRSLLTPQQAAWLIEQNIRWAY